jgi:hypothetical protein
MMENVQNYEYALNFARSFYGVETYSLMLMDYINRFSSQDAEETGSA